MAQTSGKWDNARKIWIVKAVTKGGAIVTAAAGTWEAVVMLLRMLGIN